MSKERYTNLIECSGNDDARIFIAHDGYLNRDVELKIFSSHAAADISDATGEEGLDDPRLSRSFREARTVSLLEHPSIPPILDAGQWDSESGYYTLRLARGRTLRELVDTATSRSERLRCLPALISACRTIEYGHSRGVIHRNLSPDAIVVSDHDGISVDHWAHAAVMNGAVTDPENALASSPHIEYLAPEVRTGEIGSTRSDVYSLGAILYFVCQGTTPPANMDSQPSTPSSDTLSQISRRAMSFSTEGRYEDVAALLADLSPLVSGKTGGRGAGTSERTLRRRTATRRRLVRTVGIVVALLAVIVATVYSLISDRADFSVDSPAAGLSRVDRLALADSATRMALIGKKPVEQRYEELAYWSNIATASGMVADGEISGARAALLDSPAHARHWEWGYLTAQLNRDRMSIKSSEHSLQSIAFAPDGSAVAVTGEDSIVYEWSTETGELIRDYRNHRAELRTVSYSPDGRSLVSGGWDSMVIVWDRESGQPLSRYQGHDGAVWRAMFSPDGSWVASAGHDRQIHAWDPQSGQEINKFANAGSPSARLPGHGSRIWSLAFSDDGRFLASGDMDGVIRIYDFEAGRATHTIETPHGYVTSLAVRPGSNVLLAGFYDGTTRIYSLAWGTELETLEQHNGAVWSTAYDGERGYSLTAGRDGRVVLRDSITNDVIGRAYCSGSELTNGALSPDGTELATVTVDGSIHFWPLRVSSVPIGEHVKAEHASLPVNMTSLPENDINAVAIHPDGNMVATGSSGPEITLWDIDTGAERSRLRARGRSARTLAFDENGTSLAVGWRRGAVDIWNVESGTLVRHLRSGDRVKTLAFAESAPFLAIGTEDGRIAVWDIDANVRTHYFPTGVNQATTLAFHPIATQLAGSVGELIRIWSEDTPQGVFREFEGHKLVVETLAFSPGGAFLASGSRDSSIRIWNAETGRPVAQLDDHAAAPSDLGFSSDGLRLVSGGRDETVRIFDLRTGRQVLRLDAGREVERVRFVERTHTVVAACLDGTILRWHAFPWDDSEYPGDASEPFAERIEAYKRAIATDARR